MLREDITYLEDIRDAADRAVIHAIGLTPDGLAQNVYVQDGVVRCLILIGVQVHEFGMLSTCIDAALNQIPEQEGWDSRSVQISRTRR